MRVDFEDKEIVLNKVEALFIDKLNESEQGELVTLSVHWSETFFEVFLRKTLKLDFLGCRMDTACYGIPKDFKGINLNDLDFDKVVADCEFTKNCTDHADSHKGYNENYRI